MQVNGKHYRTIWMEGTSVKMINQLFLPHKFEIAELKTHKETARAIADMVVRGAGAIGAAGAYGIAQAALEAEGHIFFEYLENAAATLRNTRPTAQNLFAGINFVLEKTKSEKNARDAKSAAVNAAQKYADNDAESCRKIGEFGNILIKDGAKIETHCNAGWLAFVDWGSALAPIYAAKRQGKKVFVYVDETRPRCQGAMLTSWELLNENIEHRIIPDNAGAYFMSKDVGLMIVGADRIAANGDVANKIGTFEKAIAAHELGVPFYVAAPATTIDLKCRSGKDIPIEERDESEVLCANGLLDSGKAGRVRIAPDRAHALNPAFDITPAKFIAGIITEQGIIRPRTGEIRKSANDVTKTRQIEKHI